MAPTEGALSDQEFVSQIPAETVLLIDLFI